MNEKVYEPTPEQAAFWHRKAHQAKSNLKKLRGQAGHKMTPAERLKLEREIARADRRVRDYLHYATGTKNPPTRQTQENTDMAGVEIPRIIELSYGPAPWRLSLNASHIQVINFAPVLGEVVDGQRTVKSFAVSIVAADKLYEFPFNRAKDAQDLYEYIKSELVSVGITVRSLAPTPIPNTAPQPEVTADSCTGIEEEEGPTTPDMFADDMYQNGDPADELDTDGFPSPRVVDDGHVATPGPNAA